MPLVQTQRFRTVRVFKVNSTKERLTTSALLVRASSLPHAIGVGLHAAHKVSVVILTSKTADLLWCLSSSQSVSIGFSIQDEPMDVARSAPQRAHYHADVMHLLSQQGEHTFASHTKCVAPVGLRLGTAAV